MLNLPNQSKYYIFYKKSDGEKKCVSLYPKRSRVETDAVNASLSNLLRETIRWNIENADTKKTSRNM